MRAVVQKHQRRAGLEKPLASVTQSRAKELLMSETSIAIPLHTLKALLDEVSEHYADGIPKGFLQIDATPQPPGKPTPRRRRPPQPRRTRARSSQTTTYQAKRAAMEDLPLKRLRRHGFTPYFGDEKRFLMTPPEFDLVLAWRARLGRWPKLSMRSCGNRWAIPATVRTVGGNGWRCPFGISSAGDS